VLAQWLWGWARDVHAQAQKPTYKGPYNFLFILTDQERFFRPGELPEGYSLPAHARLAKRGTTFVVTREQWVAAHRPPR
jgi:hypothetical protein